MIAAASNGRGSDHGWGGHHIVMGGAVQGVSVALSSDGRTAIVGGPDDNGYVGAAWIFVAPMLAGQGIGTALLRAAVAELRTLGFSRLASTFLLGNHSSMLWHWRMGFRLTAYPFSRRRWNEPRSGSSQ